MQRMIVRVVVGGVIGTLIASLPIILVILTGGPGDAQGGLGMVFAFMFLGPLGLYGGLIGGFIYSKNHSPATAKESASLHKQTS